MNGDKELLDTLKLASDPTFQSYLKNKEFQMTPHQNLQDSIKEQADKAFDRLNEEANEYEDERSEIIDDFNQVRNELKVFPSMVANFDIDDLLANIENNLIPAIKTTLKTGAKLLEEDDVKCTVLDTVEFAGDILKQLTPMVHQLQMDIVDAMEKYTLAFTDLDVKSIEHTGKELTKDYKSLLIKHPVHALKLNNAKNKFKRFINAL